jgi:uncharacterized membrane protein YfcA
MSSCSVGENIVMQEIFFEFTLVISLSFLIGFGSSMVGVSGGVFKTPVLIIIIGLSASFATAISLFSALFVAIPSTIRYYRNEKKPTLIKVGLLTALISIPGLLVGIILKDMVVSVNDYLLRVIFGISLFPVALMMLLAKRKQNGKDSVCEVSDYNINSNSTFRLLFAGIGFFVTGVASSMLGLGGGVLYVPIMCIILGMPMLSAAATSVFVMLFTSTAGTIMNFAIIPQMANILLFIFYSSALGIGLVIGSILGAGYACKVDGIILRRFFGVILIFPLIHLMRLGQLWLDPLETSTLTGTVGDIIIWIMIILPCSLVWIYWYRKTNESKQALDNKIEQTKGS